MINAGSFTTALGVSWPRIDYLIGGSKTISLHRGSGRLLGVHCSVCGRRPVADGRVRWDGDNSLTSILMRVIFISSIGIWTGHFAGAKYLRHIIAHARAILISGLRVFDSSLRSVGTQIVPLFNYKGLRDGVRRISLHEGGERLPVVAHHRRERTTRFPTLFTFALLVELRTIDVIGGSLIVELFVIFDGAVLVVSGNVVVVVARSRALQGWRQVVLDYFAIFSHLIYTSLRYPAYTLYAARFIPTLAILSVFLPIQLITSSNIV